METNKIYEGDCLQILKTFPDDCIDMCLTSPPYYGLRNYNIPPNIWGGTKDCKHEFIINKIKDPMDRGGKGDHDKEGLSGNKINPKDYEVGYCKLCGAWKGNLGLEPTPQEYINHLVEIFTEVMRVLKKEGVFFLNIGDSYGSHRSGKDSEKNFSGEDRLNSLHTRNALKNLEKQKLLIPHRVAIAMQEKGFIVRDDICWIKKMVMYPDKKSFGSTMPFPVKDKLLPATEYVFQIVKSKKYYFNLSNVKTEIKNSTIERAKRPISSTYTNNIEGNPYTKHDGMKGYYDKIKDNYIDDNESSRRTRTKMNLCVGKEGYSNRNVKGIEVENANPTNAIMFRRMNQNSKKIPQQHFASYPLTLADFFINLGCPENGIVLDPFGGSMTTALAALKLQRKFICIELNKSYIELGKNRLKPYLEQKQIPFS